MTKEGGTQPGWSKHQSEGAPIILQPFLLPFVMKREEAEKIAGEELLLTHRRAGPGIKDRDGLLAIAP